jgi:hypothetical protein
MALDNFWTPRALARHSGVCDHGRVALSTYEELLEIRRGRGMLSDDIATRVGPRLRNACGVTKTDSAAAVRRTVANRLVELSGALPADLRISVLAALALHPEAGHQFVQDRMSWAARQINRDHPRAAVRRMKVGLRILAEQLDDLVTEPRTNQDWHTASLRSLLRMDLDPPELMEERVIVADADRLDEIEVRLSAPNPRPASEIHGAVVNGGELVRAEPVSTSRFVLRLPRPLRAGDRHEFRMRFAALSRTEMRPYYVLTPLHPCARFAVRVRFHPDAVPPKIWRVAGVPPRVLDDAVPLADVLDVDRIGEVAVEFSDLQQGLSYGVQWSDRVA